MVLGGILCVLVLLGLGFVVSQQKLNAAKTERERVMERLLTTKQEVAEQQNLFRESQETFRTIKQFVDRIHAYSAYNERLNQTVGDNTQRLLTALSNKQAMTIRNFDPVYNQFRQIGSSVFSGAYYSFEITGNYRAIGNFIADMENSIPLHIFESFILKPTTDSAEQLQANIKLFVVDGVRERPNQ